MATAAKRAVLQTALSSVQGLRRRRLGHIGANHYRNDLDKWGRKLLENGGNGNGMPSNLLAAGGARRPAPRASLVLGGEKPRNRRKNGLATTASAALDSANGINGGGDVNANGKSLSSNMMEQQRTSMTSRAYVNGYVNGYTNGLIGTNNNNNNNNTNNGLSAAKNGAQPRKKHQEPNKSSSGSGSGNNNNNNGYSSDLIVVLDMDECLIHSQFLSDRLVDKYRQVEDRPASRGDGNNEEAFLWNHCDSFRINLPDGDLVNVNKRPNLDLFLKEITGKFETYIFTAAMEVYAAPVLDTLDPNGDMFRGRFFREHCVYDPEMGVYSKDLCDVLRMRKMTINGAAATNSVDDCLPCDERRVVLVDNNPLSFLPNPSNGILVSSFYDDPKDDTLEAVMELLHELDDSEDVRPVLDDRFGLKDALDDVVKGASVGW